MVNDLPNGPFKRFHESGEVSQEGTFEKGKLHGTRKWFSTDSKTTENTRPPGVSELVWRSEMDYVHDRVVAIRHFNRAGERVLPKTGEPYPLKPASVDEGSEFVEPKDEWHKGDADGTTQKKLGRWRIWTRDGQLKREVHYVDDVLHGSAKLELSEDERPFRDPAIVMERGHYVKGERAGKWELCRADGAVVSSCDYGDVQDLGIQRRVEFANGTHHHWAVLAKEREGRQAYVEALLLWARAGDLGEFNRVLQQVARPVRDDVAVTLAMEVDKPFHWLGHELIHGANPAVLLNKIGVALDQAFQSRAALDFTNAAILLDPERSEFLFTRSLILMSLGLKAQAERDANDLAADSPDRAEFLLAYLSGLFPSWGFAPASETPSSTFEDLPDAPTRTLDEVRTLSRKYATRLMVVRAALLERLTPANPAVPPEVTRLLPNGPVELESGDFEVETEDGEVQTIEFNEQLDIGDADLPTLLRLARADWNALTWLCWAVGEDEVTELKAIEPPEDFGVAAGMAQQRLWRARDQRVFKGRNALQHGVPGFEWEGNDIGELPPPVAGIAEQQYAELQALFLWLTDESLRTPWQDNLRGS